MSQYQADRAPILLAPGPTEIDPVVLKSMSHTAESHFSQAFCNTFGDVLSMLRKLFQSKDPAAQPFVIGGSGTLGWDFVATNFLEPGDSVLCLSTGFFSDAFEKCLSTYGIKTTKLKAVIGASVPLKDIEQALKAHPYKALIVTHVETSTAVLTNLKSLSDLLKRISPETLFVVDGVASVSCEELQFDAWDIDVVVTGSQKALSCPPGLSIMMVSAKALTIAQSRQTPHVTWYANLSRWLPIMRNYEAKQPSYFATPPTQLIHALHASLTSILSRPLSDRFARHIQTSTHVKSTIESLGLSQLAPSPADRANGLTAFWLPDGLSSSQLLSAMLARGITLAAGMHPDFGTLYVRFGHMGYAAVYDEGALVERGLVALRAVMEEFWVGIALREVCPAEQESGFSQHRMMRAGNDEYYREVGVGEEMQGGQLVCT